uniref:Uncharacterized protein n=1 Tax=Anguilla anguilla TaxID=7936 RepID=A0A0E9W125_ANGAN
MYQRSGLLSKLNCHRRQRSPLGRNVRC